MSKQTSKASKKQKRDDQSDTDSSVEDLQPIHFFVPGENINAAVLVDYITQYVDRTAKITSSHHPTVRHQIDASGEDADHDQDKTRTGFTVLARKTLNAVSLRDLINDSKDWDVESQSKRYRKDPYRYVESDTARRRARQGASKGGTVRPPRPAREASAEPESYRREKASIPPSNVPAQYNQYQSSQSHEMQRTTGGYNQGSSRPEHAPSTYNIYNTVNTTSYSASIPASTAQYMATPYQGAYSQTPKQGPEYPPPSYEQSNTRGPPRPPSPGHPDPDAFDPAEEKPRGDQPSSRQGSIAPREEARSYTGQSRRPLPYDEMMRRSSHRG